MYADFDRKIRPQDIFLFSIFEISAKAIQLCLLVTKRLFVPAGLSLYAREQLYGHISREGQVPQRAAPGPGQGSKFKISFWGKENVTVGNGRME